MSALAIYQIESATVSGGQLSSSSWCTPRNTGYQPDVGQSSTGADMALDELRAETAFWNQLSAETLLKFEESLE